MQHAREPSTSRSGDCGCATCAPKSSRGGGCGGAGNLQMQPAVRVGAAHDASEREADRVAQQVMRMPAGGGAPPPITRGGEHSIARQARGARASGEVTASTLSSATSQGRPLDSATRGFFEPRFGRDLGAVRVHTGGAAQQLTERIDAAAFTYGNDIAFGAGQYRPDSTAGRRLLAHELTHTVQQQGGPSVIRRNGKKEAAEAEAQLGKLAKQKEEEVDPKAGKDVQSFFIMGVGEINLSSDRAHVRRTIARLIGKLGPKEAQKAIEGVESMAEMWGDTTSVKIAKLARAQFDDLAKAWTKFSADCRNAAIARLKINHKALGEWRDYVAGLAPTSVMNQTLAAQEIKFMQSIADREAYKDCKHTPMVGPYRMKELAEHRAWSPSPGYRRWVEALNNGEINGGCQDCHTQKSIPDYDRSFAEDDPARTPPVFRMMWAADEEFFAPPALNPRILDKPVQGVGPSDEVWEMVQDSPGLASIAESAESISPKIMPLVDQYKVVPISVINRPFTPGTLVAAILILIDKRRDGYVDLQEKVAAEDYDFLQLLPVVETFLGTVDADVRVMIKDAQAQSEAAQEARRTGLTIMGIIAMLLTIFPPTAPLGIALGIGVAAAGVYQGYLDYEQGLQFQQGTGAEVFSPEQEAAAGALMAGGLMGITLNAFTLVAAGIGAARALARGLPKPPPPGTINQAWKITNFNAATGEMTVVGKNLAPGGAGELATVRINVRTGMGTATMHGPDGMTVPIVNGKLQFNAGALPEVAGGTGSTAIVPTGSTAMVPAGSGSTALVPTGAASGGLQSAPGTLMLPAGQGPSFIRGYLAVGDEASAVAGTAARATRPQYGSRVVLQSDAPALGEAPVYAQGLGKEGTSGVRLMNRGLRPGDYANEGYVGNTLADDPVHLDLWLRAEASAARSAEDNIYKEWLAAMRNGTVSSWSSKRLHAVYRTLWDRYKVLAREQGIDVATLHHWNYNKNLFPEQVVDPRNLQPFYGQATMRGGYHEAHQGGVHRQVTTGHPTRDPIATIHERPLYNYDVPQQNPDFPDMPYGWHPPMVQPDMPFGWNPFYPPKYDWPGGFVPTRPPQ